MEGEFDSARTNQKTMAQRFNALQARPLLFCRAAVVAMLLPLVWRLLLLRRDHVMTTFLIWQVSRHEKFMAAFTHVSKVIDDIYKDLTQAILARISE